MAAEDVDDEATRAVVKTYVPEYQKIEWKEHAADLDMTQSEFVRTMVQAGRRGFLDGQQSASASTDAVDGDVAHSTDTAGRDASSDGAEESSDSGISMTERAYRLIDDREPVDWDDLYDALVGDVESDLDQSLQDLQTENRITYSGRQGGYVVIGGDDAG